MADQYEQTDFASVYFNPRERIFLVVETARRGHAQGEVGEPIEISEAEFETRIAAELLKALDSYRTKVWSQEIARRTRRFPIFSDLNKRANFTLKPKSGLNGAPRFNKHCDYGSGDRDPSTSRWVRFALPPAALRMTTHLG
jgi:hypothetical protein